MKNSLRIAAVILGCCLAVGGMAGCGGTGEPTPESNPGSDIAMTTAAQSGDPSAAGTSPSGGTQTGESTTSPSGGEGSQTRRPGETNKTNNKTNATTKKAGQGNTPTEAPAKKLNATITIASIWQEQWIGSKTPDKNETPAHKKAVEEFNKTLDEIEEEYGVTINFKKADAGGIVNSIITSFSGGSPYADIVEISPVIYYTLVTNKSALLEPYDSNPVININDSQWFGPNKEFTKYGGKTYGLSWITDLYETPVRNVMYFNKRILEQYGYTDLYSMVEDGTWTWDEFEKIARDIQTKSGGAVKGLTGFSETALVYPFIASNDSLLAKENGKGQYDFVTKFPDTYLPRTQAALDFVHQLIYEDKLWLEPDSKGTENHFVAGKAAFMVLGFDSAANNLAVNMKDDYGILPLPKGPDATEYVGHYGEGRFFCLLKENSKTKNLENASIILNAIAARSYVSDWKTMEMERSLRDRESADMLEIMINNPVVDITPNCGAFRDQVEPTLTDIVVGKRNSSYLKSIQNKAQTALDTTFKR